MRPLLLLAALWSGCGYVGEPLPPLLNIPSPVTDLEAKQVGDRIRIEFSIPPLTTEGEPLENLERVELRIGPGGEGAFSPDAWAAGATVMTAAQPESGTMVFEAPAAPWIGREVVIGANLLARNGRASGWSNLASVAVAPPLSIPGSITVTAVKEGVRVAWSGSAPAYRVFRRAPGESTFTLVAEIPTTEWVDTAAEYGKAYAYRVTGVAKTSTGEAVSPPSLAVQIVPEDRFAPDPPSGLHAVASTSTVELAWEPSSGAASYAIYRAGMDGEWELVGSTAGAPAYSDKPPSSGVVYRYAVSARDPAGNESAKSESVQLTAP